MEKSVTINVTREMNEFGQSIINFRRKFKIKQTDLANEIGISVNTLRSIEQASGTASYDKYLTVKWFMKKYIAAHPVDENDDEDDDIEYDTWTNMMEDIDH